MSRMIAIEASRRRWYSLSVNVCTGAIVMLSPAHAAHYVTLQLIGAPVPLSISVCTGALMMLLPAQQCVHHLAAILSIIDPKTMHGVALLPARSICNVLQVL